MSDPYIYIYRHDDLFAMIGIDVDDLKVACNSTQ
jgi:hypothetical protein